MTGLSYAYLEASGLAAADGRNSLSLATSGGSDPSGAVAHPYFFSGFVEYPAVVAQALLVLARISRTRFYTPPNTLAAVLRAADPVVTSTPEGLRFEAFSVCCGVYARFDVDAAALDATHRAVGVTNVDVNPPLRQALAGLAPSEPLLLNVGADELRVTTMDAAVVEERVELPKRWLKGFAETQLLSAEMVPAHELNAQQARLFLQGLPKSSPTKSVMWAAPVARGLRLASRPGPGAVCLAGPERLRVIEPLLRFSSGLRSYGNQAGADSLPAASGWVLELPGGRLTLALSPEKARGFSGEGAVLHSLSGVEVADDADLISALLAFDSSIDVARLSAAAALPTDRVLGALALLATSGQVGFDLAAGSYFHRPLPVLPEALLELHPRLASARKLVEAGAVRLTSPGRATVRSGDQEYEVKQGPAPADDRCTCPWYAKHRSSRGPCKHVLAARIQAAEQPETP